MFKLELKTRGGERSAKLKDFAELAKELSLAWPENKKLGLLRFPQ